MAEPATVLSSLHRTPLHGLHVARGARMVPFAGYEMPVQYAPGILAEHLHTRQQAGLFDVSHMGQAFLRGPDHATTASALERLVPGDVLGLKPGRVRYTQLTNSNGGIIDDLMVTRPVGDDDDGTLYLVVNASRKGLDFTWIEQNLPASVALVPAGDRALLALQGPAAEAVLSRHAPQAKELAFMAAAELAIAGMAAHVSRSGYTGEDGFEISVAARLATSLAETLLGEPEVLPIGLGARDSLRLEAGLCLYGHDIDDTTSPIEAGLAWSIGKRRREAGGFTGSRRIQHELQHGPSRRRVGLKPDGRVPAREGTAIQDKGGARIGTVTSGGFGPTVGGPVAMGYVAAGRAAPGSPVDLSVRDKLVPAAVTALPFVPHAYKH